VVDVDLARRSSPDVASCRGERSPTERGGREARASDLADLWSYDVSLVEVDATDTVLKEHVVNRVGSSPRRKWLPFDVVGASAFIYPYRDYVDWAD